MPIKKKNTSALVSSIEITGEINKTRYKRLLRHLKLLSDYLNDNDKIVANCVPGTQIIYDINIQSVLFETPVNIVIRYIDSFRPMEIICLSHNFSSFSTEFLKTTGTEFPSKISVVDEECWSPSVCLGVMYIYFVNFFREFIDQNQSIII